MKKFALVLSVFLALSGAGTALSEENSAADYTWLENLSVKELRALDAEIHKLLPASDPTAVPAAAATAEPLSVNANPLGMTLDCGDLTYTGYEYANAGLLTHTSGDCSKTIILKFKYTNFENRPKNYTNDFMIHAFQNGAELPQVTSYTTNNAPLCVKNAWNQVMKDGSVEIGKVLTLTDYSPITIYVYHNGGSEISEPNVVAIEEYKDTSFDLNRIFGRWSDKNSGTILEISLNSVKLTRKNGNSSSSSSTSTPNLWTDENTLHCSLNDLDGARIIETKGQPLTLKAGSYSFIQLECWGDISSMEETPVVGDPDLGYTYYEEVPVLPTAESALGLKSPSKSTTFGSRRKVEYKYSVASDVMTNYIDFLRDYGFDVKEGKKETTVSVGKTKVCTISYDGSRMVVNLNLKAINLKSVPNHEAKKNAPSASEGTETSGTVSSNNVNLRKSSSKSSASLGKLKRGDTVTILGEENGWYHVTCSLGEGYLPTKYVNQ